MNNTTSTRSIVLEKELRHSPEKVWRALTQGPLLEEWLMKNDFEPVVGRKFKFQAKPMPQWDGIVNCEVLVVEPCTKLAYAWNVGDDPTYGLKTVVNWTLTPTANGVLVRMEHDGFREDQEQNYKGAQFGWQKFMAGLESTVDKLQ